MSVLVEVDQAGTPANAESPLTTPRGWRKIRLPLGVCVLVGMMAQLPLIGNRIFYYADDSASVFLPSWHYIGSQLLAGNWPMLAGDLWHGGNIAAEDQLSLWNPVMLLNDLMVAVLPDIAVSATIVKTEFLILLALGTYLLCREYGAKQGPSFVVAMLIPFAGFNFYFDASGWAISMISFAWIPHVWWSARRCARGQLNPIVPVLLAFMAMTCGSPYGALGVIVTMFVLIVERLVLRENKAALRLLLMSLAIGMSAVVVYIPLVLAGDVTFRTNVIALNNGFMVGNLSDILNLSSPVYLPGIRNPVGTMAIPYAYLGWFIFPMLPWFKWSILRENLKYRVALLVFATIYVFMTMGPSDVWLFRWPIRLIDYAYLPLCILLALLLSAGLQRDNLRRRAVFSAALIGMQTILAWSAKPGQSIRYLLVVLIISGLLAFAVFLARRQSTLFLPLLAVGSIVFFVLQLVWYPYNAGMVRWNLPTNISEMQSQFHNRYLGNTFVVGKVALTDTDAAPDKLWKDILHGSDYLVAGVDALNSYTGIGFVPFDNMFCMIQEGQTCRAAYSALWQTDPTSGTTMADTLKLQTVVVLNKSMLGDEIDPQHLPTGWIIKEKNDQVTVLSRVTPQALPQGRVSWTDQNIRVIDDQQLPNSGEDISYTGGGKVILAALDWPGMTATVDGREIPITRGTAGLVTLNLPQSSSPAQVELRFWPPGFTLGIPLMIAGLLLAAIHGVLYARARRRSAQPNEEVPAS